MISALNINEIISLVKSVPEQSAFDWKNDFIPPTDDEKRGEIIKDIVAIANASPLSYGFLVYGVNPKKADPIAGTTSHYDDSKLQQLLKGKVEPLPEFLYYEVSTGTKTVSVIQVAPSKKRPFIISVDMGKIRAGQIPIRRGSSTDGVKLSDLFNFFYGQHSDYFHNVIHQLGIDIQQQNAQTAYQKELRQQLELAEKNMRDLMGF